MTWKIFTPVLNQIDQLHISPIIYPFGSRGPPEADEELSKLGYKRHNHQYHWPKQSLSK
jgi:glucose-6-phosphate 1-dehydrogenase